jgi:hypothetical protein
MGVYLADQSTGAVYLVAVDDGHIVVVPA